MRDLAEESLRLCENHQAIYLEQATHWVQHDEPERCNQAFTVAAALIAYFGSRVAHALQRLLRLFGSSTNPSSTL